MRLGGWIKCSDRGHLIELRTGKKKCNILPNGGICNTVGSKVGSGRTVQREREECFLF